MDLAFPAAADRRFRRKTVRASVLASASAAILAVASTSVAGFAAWRQFARRGPMESLVQRAAEAAEGLSYKDVDYWESRYRTGDKGANPDHIDDRGVGWLCTYDGPVMQTLNAITGEDKSKTLLNIGCGMDRLSEDVYADGYTNLLSSDISPSAIGEMAAKTAATMPAAKWFVDDVLGMTVASQSVDVVLDKGTMDALLIRPNPFANAAQMLREVQRVLKVGGTYLLITHGRGDPDTWRLPLLAMPHLSMNIAKTPDLGGYYIFVCTKLEEPNPDVEAANWAKAQVWASERDLQDHEAELDFVDEVGQ